MVSRPSGSRKPERWRSMTVFGNNTGLLLVAALLACLSGCCLPQASAQTNSLDQAALTALRQAWNRANALPTWVGDDACGNSWFGVLCNKDGDVIQLSLANTNISGTIPAAIGDLASLQILELSLNPGLGGTLPKELGKLSNLQSLSIQQCSISGGIPVELSNLTNLEFLALNNNQMEQTIPPEIGRLSKLYWFDISLNTIGGDLPTSTGPKGVGLDNLTSIKHFHFNNNTLQGNIPAEIFNLPNLIHLLLDSNLFIGEIPNNASKSLVIMRLDNNQLTGTIPNAWSQMTNLTEIHVNDNQLGGVFPDLSQLQKLRLLDASNNKFDPQPIPDFLTSAGTAASATGMTNLQTLIMSNCNLEGRIPQAIFNNPAIQKIDLSNNRLNGTVTFGEIGVYLEVIDLEVNNVTGVDGSPTENGRPVGLDSLLLKGNPVCTSSQFIDAEKYCVDDSGATARYPQAPFCGGKNCTDGTVLHGGNCICGNALICKMKLNAPPYQIVDQKAMDGLRGAIADLFSEKNVVAERLPVVDGQVTDLDVSQLWIEQANLTDNGRINFTLAIFPPTGKNWRKAEVNYMVNFFYNNTVHLNASNGPYNILGYVDPVYRPISNKSSLSTGALIGIIVGGVFAVIILLLFGVYGWRQKRRADQAEVITRPFASWGTGGGSDNGAAPKLMGARYFTVSELKKATNNFSERNVVGSGGYGKVYKALLADGAVVAVKRAQEGSMQGKDEFKNEIELLSRVHHRNLVSLVGFCYDRDQKEQMLIYEFMRNGTLRDHLLGKMGEPFTWQSRLNVALGSAKGLSYLHELANPPVIHRDIKSTNILLDERMTAKVADFGLSKTAPDDGGKDHVSTQVKGTMGYLDPEYYTKQQLTEKSDVYSFGVVLLELLTARAPIENNKYIVREVRDALDKGGIAALRSMLDRHIRDCPSNELEDFLQLALQCVEEGAKNRPTMNEVVKELERICGHSLSSSVGGGGSGPVKDPYSDLNFLSRDKETQYQYSGNEDNSHSV